MLRTDYTLLAMAFAAIFVAGVIVGVGAAFVIMLSGRRNREQERFER